ncbi:phosphatidate cytidylyltransferase [Pelagibacterales bacterium SAG-MED11]|nr:phosphatidate cytidylyltransferase [Pelagibacterales bacterium SAG-MED11]
MSNLIKRILSSVILLPLILYFILMGSFYLKFLIIICFLAATYEWHKMVKKINYKLLGFIFLFFSFYTFYELSIKYTILIPFFICISTDIGGFIFGKIFKGPKLTKISPNKTYAGMIGGYFLSIIFISLYFNYLNHELTIIWFITIILISSVSQLGDIIISYFKRLSKLKNTGNIIPGHGGILDRIDGMIFAFPIYYLIELSGYLI